MPAEGNQINNPNTGGSVGSPGQQPGPFTQGSSPPAPDQSPAAPVAQAQDVFSSSPPPPRQPSSTEGVEPVFSAAPSQVQSSENLAASVIAGDISQKKKKGFSKVYLLVVFVILIFGILGLLLWKFWPGGLPGFGKKGEIVWWGLWEEEEVMSGIIDEYEKDNPNVKIKYINQSQHDYRERLKNSLARGEGPDIFRFHNTWVPMFRNELDKIPPSVISAEEFSQIYYPVMVSDLTRGSDLVGIPLGYDALTLYINEDFLAQAGGQPPETWNDFRELAARLTIREEGGAIIRSGAALGKIENVDHWPEILALMMIQNGVNLSQPKGSLADDAISFYMMFSSVDNVWNETLPPSTIAFANGKTAMYFGPTWRAFEIMHLNSELRFRTFPLPQLPKDSPDEKDVSFATYWAEGVWAQSPNKEEAWKFMKFLSSKESLEKMYKSQSQTRLFGEPYPRTDMANLISDHPIAGSIINQAPDARSWYLSSRTFDGSTGINSQIIKYYEDAINSIGRTGRIPDKAGDTLNSGVYQVLSQYGLVR